MKWYIFGGLGTGLPLAVLIWLALVRENLAAIVILSILGVLLLMGIVYAMFMSHAWLSALFEQRRFNANVKENLAYSQDASRLLSQQNQALIRQVQQQQKMLPGDDSPPVIIDGRAFDEFDIQQ